MKIINITYLIKLLIFILFNVFFSSFILASELNMVKDIYIELNFKNNQDYRKKALESSYEIAFRRYLNWITLENKADIEKIVADLVPKDYVLGYSIESEKFKKEKYSALISINFEKEKIEKLLISKNIKFYNKKGPKTLIIPLLNFDKRMVLWDDPNPWFEAWIRRPLDSNLTNFILPSGEVEDLITLNAEDANNLKYYKIKKLATRYEAVDALVLKIDLVLENNEYNYYLKAYDGLSQEEISISELNYIQTKNINAGLYNLSNEFANFYDDMPMSLTGGATLMGVINHMVIRGQFVSLIVSVFIILIIMSFVFKSLIGGLIATLPMAVSVSMMFGLMGYLDITLNITTSLLTCILVGVGVDYTVHFLWHLKDHLSDGDSLDEAIANTFRISGKGILFNGLSVVMGFSALLFSVFVPVRIFGILVMGSILFCLFGALATLPALTSLIKPKFLFK